ncbi:MAG: hypothetical protein JWM14_1168 [Chitinophagaceae bacterium]|nr:hypothetical protein [Chitinophagaceae bacterium]
MKTSYYLLIFIFALSTSRAQQSDMNGYRGAIGEQDWTKNWTSFSPNGNHYMTHSSVIPRIIDKDLTLTNKNTYLLSGAVYVTNKAVLTIEAGTVIRGESETCGTLVITKGSKLIAAGTERDPIVFTSNKSVGERKSGDWGGIILIGNAMTNHIGGVNAIDWGLDTKYTQYGGDNDDDNSGIIRYVRIEYSGNKIKIDEEFNGLTLAAVGKHTLIDHVQVSYSNDDSFELYGGSVEPRNIISYKCSDDDFDFNYGYQGKVQEGISFRNPLIGDFSGSRCFEVDSYNADKKGFDANKRITKVEAYNFTLIQYDLNGNNKTSFCSEALQIGPDCQVSISNSVVSGFTTIFKVKNAAYKDDLAKGTVKIENNSFNGMNALFAGNNAEELRKHLENQPVKNILSDAKPSELFVEINNKIYPNLKFINAKTIVVSK